MHKPAAICSIFSIVLLLAGCAPCEQPAPVDKAAEAQAISDQSAQWLAWSQERNSSAIGGLFVADAETIFDGQLRQGAAAIQADLEKEYAESPDATMSWTTGQVYVSDSGDLAYERGSWVFDKDGAGEEPEKHGEYLTVWKKVGGEWKVAIDSGTTIKPEEEAAEE